VAVGYARFSDSLRARLDEADVRLKLEEFGMAVVGTGAIVWVGVMALDPPPVLGLLTLPVAIAVSGLCAIRWLGWRKRRRIAVFTDQLELVLRMLAGALRIGLGLRQAVILVTDEVAEPARREFMRVIGRTNIGMTTLESFDQLAASMESAEVTMMARAMRVQAQTGGDLAKVLETLADTIKDRRHVFRKMRALTAQGRAGAYLIGALPLLVGGFIVFTQPTLGHALAFTLIGRIALGAVGILEAAAIVSLSRILQYDV
jgi:tight adherence protein B